MKSLRSLMFSLLLCLGGSAHAQLLPSLGGLPQLDRGLLREPVGRLLEAPQRIDLGTLRLTQIDSLLRRHRDVLEADPRGEPMVRREILAWSPSATGLAAARMNGLVILRGAPDDALAELSMLVLGVPEHADTAATLAQLRALDPDGVYDFNHVYTGSGSASTPMLPAMAMAGLANSAGSSGTRTKVGLIDSGVDASHAVFHDAAIRHWGCASEARHPSAHGTAVAALMVGSSQHFRGVAPELGLYAADIYCDSASGGSADKIAGALAWMAKEQIGVINLSLVGPRNATLERVVGAMLRRGHVLVAAVGNDGPAAPPLYPASFAGVVGVTGVDRHGRTLPEAARGAQVMFAAPGKQMVSAAVGEPAYRQVRGTSFAAPIVAAMLARHLGNPDPAAAGAALAALAARASKQQGSPNHETGLGIVGQSYRIDPARLRHRR